MKVTLNDTEPIEQFCYKVVATGGRNEAGLRSLKDENLPIYLGALTGADIAEIDYLIIASDLQGNVFEGEEVLLLGELLPAFLSLLFDVEFEGVDRNRVGVFLCGDLYARLDKRGGLGDVKNVWRVFNKHFGFVVGVAGNHDDFGSAEDFENFKKEEGIYFLDKGIKKIGNLNIGGISGIIGRPGKPFRNEESKHLKDLGKLLRKQTDFILLHEGPSHLDPKLPGNDEIRMLIERSRDTIICCGHNHWETTLVSLDNNVQIINADAKCIVLKVEQ